MTNEQKNTLLIVGLNGSPKKDGNTAVLLHETLQECSVQGARTEIINCREALQGQKNPFCVNCESPCQAKCAVGKPLEKVFATLSKADGLVIGSPVYFGTVSGQLKAFWDKTRSLRSNHSLLNVVGGAVSVGSSQYGGEETTVKTIHSMMLVHGMIVVGDGYIDDDCGHFGALATKPAAEDSKALERARVLGRRIVQVARSTMDIRAGRK
ncbi:MAG: flavodoxin family protein [Chitinophagales bacterium]